MDQEIDANIGYFGANLESYPNVRQFGNYNEKLSIDNEMPIMDYKRVSSDDLSHVWATNNRDNIDDLNLALRDANINAYDVDFYGATALNVIENEVDFSKQLRLNNRPEYVQPEYIESVEHVGCPAKRTHSCGSIFGLGGSLLHMFLLFVVVIFLSMLGYSVVFGKNNMC